MDAPPRTIVQPQIHLLGRLEDVADLDLPWQNFSQDWDEAPVPDSIGAGFRLSTDGRRFRFEARSFLPPAQPVPGSACGVFMEELWTQDVGELFLGEDGSTRYTEWNLSPHGAWWAQGFRSRRIRDPDYAPPPQVKTWVTQGTEGSHGWQAGLSFPLPPDLPVSSLRLNVTMILGHPLRRYLAAVVQPGSAPDFHLPESFPKPTLRSAGENF
jgi:hypothetical protein